ncbi:MAG: helix-turn-helix domain-containing protein [Verrucomicrobia bacterium]|nr:MAG: helix-turn-helix domain-containing protein [Verrucomicrobiota bacterium]
MIRLPTKTTSTRHDVKWSFATVLRACRGRLGISQEELAGRAGLHRTYVSDIERGARNLSLESIDKLAKALGIPVSTLFSRLSDPQSRSGTLSPVATDDLVDILLVEGDRDDVKLTLRAFNNANFTNRIYVVADGAEALDFLFRSGGYAHRWVGDRPKVILLDLKLPDIGGLEVLRRIKAEPQTRMIPVVVLTESPRHRDIAECRRLGVEAYITKPVDFLRFTMVTPQLRLQWALLKSGSRAFSTGHPRAGPALG